jgi:hypothetical protein
MAKISKVAKCDIGIGGKGMGILTLLIYLVVAYIIYRIVTHFLNYRPSAMPNIPEPSSKGRSPGGCSTGTCGSK